MHPQFRRPPRRRLLAQGLAWGAFILAAVHVQAAVAGEMVTPEWVNQLGEELAGLAGLWISQEVVLGVRWMTLVASAGVLLAAGLAHAILRWIIRRKIRADEAKAKGAPAGERESYRWLDRGLQAAIPPLALLLWVYGLFAALALILLDFQSREAAEGVLRGLRAAKAVGVLAAWFWLLYRVGAILELRLSTFSLRKESTTWDRILFPLAGKTLRLTLPLLVLILGVPMLPVSPDIRLLLQNGISLLLIAAVALILFQIVQAAENFILARYGVERADRFQARRIRTQVTVLKKIVVVIIGIFTLASMLMIFESVRQFGTSILASAGIAGIIIGLAAQRSIATLLAGIQLAFTRPIRIDDVVVVENEWGRIEDITLTFVIVCIWDKRRLILPITYFMEHPFQNWTSTSSDVLGTVFLHVDYTMPIQALREELDRIVEKSQYWDGQSKSVLVTNAKEHTLEVRAMASAADGDQAWFLRCEIREKLVEFIQKNYPGSLPRLRAELEPMQEVKTERRESVKQAGRGR